MRSRYLTRLVILVIATYFAFNSTGTTAAPAALRTAAAPEQTPTTALGSLAASMQPGTWATLTTNNLNPTLGPTFGGSSNNVLAEGPEMQWDPASQQVLFFGSDHCDLSQFISYSVATNTWQRMPRASWMPTSSDYCHGMTHGEDGGAIDQANGIYYYNQHLQTKRVHRYNIATQTWNDLPPVNDSGWTDPTVGFDYFPEMRSLIVVNGGGYPANNNKMYIYSEDTGQWRTPIALGQTWGDTATYRNFVRYNPVHKLVIFSVRGFGDNRLWKMDAAGTITRLKDAPIGLGIMCPCAEGSVIIVSDPVTGDYIVINKNKDMWRYDVVTDTWTKLNVTVPATVFTNSVSEGSDNPIFGVSVATISTYGVHMFTSCNGSSCRVALFKYAADTAAAPPDTTAPAVSLSSPVAASTVSGAVTVSATASDAVGVAGVQFKLDGSNLDAEDTAPPYSISWNASSASNGTHLLTAVARDAAGNQTTSATVSVTVSNTTPTVSMSSPAPGATVSGTVTVSANASDGSGVAGVQFKLDGQNLASEDTAAPYTISWNTSSASNASHVLTAVVRGATGNQTTSAALTVNVNNAAAGGGTPSDFATRCAAAGVLRCVGFDQASDIAGTYGDNHGIMPGTAIPQLDSDNKASGNSSLLFTIPSNSPANSSGSYFTNFSDDLSVQFGENSEFFVQWRQRFSSEFLNTYYQGGGGWKQSIIGVGDKQGCSSSNAAGGQCASSCTALETVTQNINTRGFPQMYNSCTGSTSHSAYYPFNTPYGSYDFKLQNGRSAPYCLYSQSNSGYFPPNGNCFGYAPNEWMTFQVRVRTGPRVNDEFSNSFVELWVAREGQAAEQVLDWGPFNLTAGDPVANLQYGKVWLLPYNTNKSSAQAHPTAYTWYDELIVSRNRIADPGGTAPPPVDTIPPTISGVASSAITASAATINWTTNENSDTQVEYGTTTSYGSLTAVNNSQVTAHSQVLSSLGAGTTYNYRVKSRDASGNLMVSPNFTFATAAAADTTAPVISGVAASNVTATGATIDWTTNEAADSQVEFGLSTSYGSQSTLNAASVTSHSQALSGLTAGTTYNYRVKSRDAAGNLTTSANSTFTTTAIAGNRTIDIYPGTNVFGPAAQGLLAGDTLIVHQGTYNETNRMSLRVTGTSSAPIVIRGAVGEAKPLITRPDTAAVQNTFNLEGSATYLTIKGLEISGNGADGINMSGPVSFITLEDLDIHDIDVGINFRSSMNNIIVRHNHIHNTGIDSGTGEGMYVGCNDATCIVRDSLIEQNWIHDALPGTTQGDGIEVKFGSHSNIVRDNVIYNRPYPGIFVYGTLGNPVNIVEGNVVWNAFEGIYAVSDAIVRNNIVFNSGTGLSLYGHAQVSQMKNVTAVNNTLYNNDNGIYMRWSSAALNMVLANNAIYSPGKTALNTSGSVGTFVTNDVEGGADRALDGTAFINGGTSANAFVDPTNWNFWPKAGSPLFNVANGGYAPATDFNQTSRVSPYDLGAYESNGTATNPGWTITEGFKNDSTAPGDTTPPTIAGVTASGITATGAAITWTTNEASDSQVEYGTTLSYGNQTTLAASQLTAHSQALSGLAASTTYNYRVKSRDAAGNLATSGNFTFTTTAAPDTTAPAISSVSASAITAAGATVTWTTNEASDSQVEYGTTLSYGSQTTLAASQLTAHSQALSGLAASTTYNYRVKSRDAAGNLATSGNFTFTTTAAPDTTSPVISSVSASAITAAGATVTWATNEASDSQVEYGTTLSYGNQTTLAASQLTAHSQALSGLAASTIYNYRVKSRDAAGNLATSGNFTFTTTAAPDTTSPVISSVSASAITAAGATVTWTTNEASDSQVEYGTTLSYGSQTTLAASQLTAHSQALSGLTASATYNYRVKSRDAAGNLAISGNFTFTTTAAPDITAPIITSVTASVVTAAGATITWTTNEASNSQVEYGTTTAYGSQDTLNSTLVFAHSQTVSGLSAGTTYNYRVRSLDAAGNLAMSANLVFTTAVSQPVPPPPTGAGGGGGSVPPAPVNVPPPDPGTAFTIAAEGVETWTMNSTSGSIAVGHAEVQTDDSASALSGLAIFGFRTGGVLVTEAGVPASAPMTSGRIYVDVNGPVNTGVAFANPTAQDSEISFYFTDTMGMNFGRGSFKLKAHAQIAAFMDQEPFFGGTSMQGTFTFDSPVPVGVIALRGFTNERSEFLITTLPVSPLGNTSTSPIVLPHFADGGGWTTQVVLTNPSDSPILAMVQFIGPGTIGQNAPVLNMSVNGNTSTSTVYSIRAHATLRLVTGNASETVQSGSVRITPMAGIAPDAIAVFSFRRKGITVSEAGVAALPTGTAFRMYAEVSMSSAQIDTIQSGLAIANPSPAPVAVTLQLVDTDGSSPVPPVTVTVPANGQLARFIPELFPALTASFKGIVKTTSATPIAVIGLRGRYNERGDFLITTTPPANDAVPMPGTQLVFPHIVSGGGYSTQFILSGRAASGRLWFNSQTGSPLSTNGLTRIP